MEKYLTDEDGAILIDGGGKKVLNPEWLAANPNYTPAANEVDASGGGGGYTPDAEALAWHEAQVAGLKANQQKALASNAKYRKRAEAAQKEVERLEGEVESLRALAGGEGEIDPKEKVELLTKIGNLEKVRDTLTGQLDTAKDELHKYKYEGTIESAMSGLVKPGYQLAAKATLERLIKENEDGELECFNLDESPAINDMTGVPLTVKEFVSTVFAKSFPDMCVADSSLPTGPGGQKPGGGPKSDNPFAKDTMNRTVQSTMIKNDPAKAKQLMKAAGYDQAKINRMMA